MVSDGKRGRPLEEGIPWFKHSTVQLHNPKIQVLVQMYGMAGPGVYNALLEQIHRQAPKPYALTDSQAKYLSRLMGMYPKKLLEMVESCITIGLYSRISWESGRVLTTPEIEQGIKKTLAVREEKRRNREGTNAPTNAPTNSTTNCTLLLEVETEVETETEISPYIPLASNQFDLLKDQLQPRYPGIDWDHEVEKCQAYWEPKDRLSRKKPNWKLRLMNWMDKVKERSNGQNGGHPDGLPGNRYKGAFSDVEPSID